MTNVIIVGGNDETRMLLRGLMRLHRFRVVLEGSTLDCLLRIPTPSDGGILLMDVDIREEAWARAISEALRAHPSVRAVLLTPSKAGGVEERAKAIGIHATLRRPFAVHELIEAVGGPAREPPRGPDGEPGRV